MTQPDQTFLQNCANLRAVSRSRYRTGPRLLRLLGLVAVLCAGTLGSGRAEAAAAAPRKRTATRRGSSPKKPSGKKAKAEAPPRLEDHPLLKRLTQVENGPGVLVCEPVPAPGTEAATADFAAGCSRWLHLMVAGHGEFGKTPLWDSVDHAREELKKPNLRLTPADARRLPAMLGVTHAVLGTVEGDLNNCSLSFTVTDLTGKKPSAPPISATGSAAELKARLPELARSITMALGVASPRVPPAVGETEAELQQLGALPWLPGTRLDEKTATFLTGLADLIFRPEGKSRPARPHLAAFMRMLHAGSTRDVPYANSMGSGLAVELPENALVLGEVGRQAFRAQSNVMEEGRQAMSAALRRFPNSYLLRIGSAYYLRLRKDLKAGRAEVEMAVRCAARNPDAWLSLSGTAGSQAEAIRRSRTVDRMSPEELKACDVFYEEELVVCLKTVSLDQQYPLAWVSLCKAAAFLGVQELVDPSFDRAMTLDPADPDTLWWGLEVYQPKWYGNPARLRKVGEAAVAAADGFSPADRISLGISLRHASLPELSALMLKSEKERLEVEEHFKKGDD